MGKPASKLPRGNLSDNKNFDDRIQALRKEIECVFQRPEPINTDFRNIKDIRRQMLSVEFDDRIQALREDVDFVFKRTEALNSIARNINDIGRYMLHIIESGKTSDGLKLSSDDEKRLEEFLKSIVINNGDLDKAQDPLNKVKESKQCDKRVYILNIFSSEVEWNFYKALTSELAVRGLSLELMKVEDFNDASHARENVLVVCNNATRLRVDLRSTFAKISGERYSNVCLIILRCNKKPKKSLTKLPEELKNIACCWEMTYSTDNHLEGLKDNYNEDVFAAIISLTANSNVINYEEYEENATGDKEYEENASRDRAKEENATGNRANEKNATGNRANEENATGDRAKEENATGDRAKEEYDTGDRANEENDTGEITSEAIPKEQKPLDIQAGDPDIEDKGTDSNKSTEV